MKIGDYEYPSQVTFEDALRIAGLAITKFDGKMSNKDVGEALGYKIKNPDAISGYIFRKFDEICLYGLMKRERGFISVTDIAKDALDPYDSRKAEDGKARAIRKMSIVSKAFTEWNGEIPQETAFPSKLVDLLAIQWQEAQKHTESLRKLFIEVFPYLKSPSQPPPDFSGMGVGGDRMVEEHGTGTMTISARGKSFGFTKTLPFTDKGIKELKELANFLATQIEEEPTEEQQQNKQKTS